MKIVLYTRFMCLVVKGTMSCRKNPKPINRFNMFCLWSCPLSLGPVNCKLIPIPQLLYHFTITKADRCLMIQRTDFYGAYFILRYFGGRIQCLYCELINIAFHKMKISEYCFFAHSVRQKSFCLYNTPSG